MSTLYEISLKQEIMLEAYAGILASFREYFDAHHIDPNQDINDEKIVLFQSARNIHNSILDKSTLKEMNEVEKQFRFFKEYLESINKNENPHIQ